MEKKYTVKKIHLANSIKSGDLSVLSTPYLLAFIENICMEYINNTIDDNLTSVGVKVDLKHIKPSLEKDIIKCIIKKINKINNKLIFNVEVLCNDIVIGVCTHTRYIVNKNDFMCNIK
jgi:fluoroacetyl-CoA thioesterase